MTALIASPLVAVVICILLSIRKTLMRINTQIGVLIIREGEKSETFARSLKDAGIDASGEIRRRAA